MAAQHHGKYCTLHSINSRYLTFRHIWSLHASFLWSLLPSTPQPRTLSTSTMVPFRNGRSLTLKTLLESTYKPVMNFSVLWSFSHFALRQQRSTTLLGRHCRWDFWSHQFLPFVPDLCTYKSSAPLATCCSTLRIKIQPPCHWYGVPLICNGSNSCVRPLTSPGLSTAREQQ